MIAYEHIHGQVASTRSVVVKEHVLTGACTATNFAAGLLAKDVGIAASLAQSAEVEAPRSADIVARALGREAAGGLGLSADHSEAHKHWWEGRFDTVAEVTS